MDGMDDAALIYLALHGNQEAANILFRRYYLNISDYFKAQIWDQEITQDLAQETFLKAWKNLSQVRSSFSGWLHMIAHRVLVDYLRQRQRYPPPASLTHEHDREDRQFSIEAQLLISEDIQEELKNMPDMQHECMKLTITEQLTPDEVAQRLGLKISTVRTYISEGRKKLKDAIFHAREQ
ncbi:MAG: RNA polymerase sigma factor [Chloroflexi bacterium]|nr:MAG: RNA polymerase sigma factor [Chloroflexota bacterium]